MDRVVSQLVTAARCEKWMNHYETRLNMDKTVVNSDKHMIHMDDFDRNTVYKHLFGIVFGYLCE